MKKRLLSLLLTLVMILGMIPATALTASAAEITDADISKFEQYADYMKGTWGYFDSMNLAMITDVEIDSTGWLPNAFTAPSRYYNSTNSYSVTVNPQTGEKTYSYDYSPVTSYGAVTSSQSKELSYETFPGSTWIFADEPNRNDYGAAYLNQLIAVFNVSTREFMEDPNNLPAGAYITGFRFNFVGGYPESHLSGFPTATDYGVDLNEYINITVDGKKATRQEGSVDGLSIENLNPIPYTYQVTDTLSAGMGIGSYCDALSDAMVWGPVVYVYDEKPEINSVTVNGQSVADEGTFTTNNKNVTIKTTYDSVLSDALTAYGCKVEHLSDWYLNDQHITLAKATPVDQGDGTSTKTYTRTLNGGDVLKVYGRLEVTWPDGSTDRVDEHTMTVKAPISISAVNVGATFSGTPANATSNTDGITVTGTQWYRQNGSTWTALTSSDTIKEGYTYRCEVTVAANNGYTLADGYTVKINGTAATKKSRNTWYRDVTITGYTAYVDVYDIALPEAYTNPDFTYNDEEGAAYHWDVVQVEWFECDKDDYKLSGALTENDVFKKDTYYRIEVTVVPETSWQFDGSELSFYINDKPAMPLYGYNKAYPGGVTGYVVYNTADMEGDYELFVYDDSLSGSAKNIYIKDGQYLGSNATGATATKPASGGYAYYKDGVLELNGYDNEKAHFIFEEAALELWLIGDNTIGAIYDNEWDMAGGNLETRQGNLVINANPGGELVIASNPLDAYANIQVKDLYFKGGDVTSCLANGTYGAAVQLNDGNLYLEKGTAAYVSDSSDFATATKWDGTTDISDYENVWLKTVGTCRVDFLDDDNTVLDMVRVTEGNTVSEPDDPVKEGYEFIGWYTDDGDKFDFTTPITEDICLTAKFEPAASNITVNCIGDIDYTVSGNVVTVDHEVACKVGYLDGTAYKAITAVANGDGTYSFTAPAGVTEVLLVVKGDVSGDGFVTVADKMPVARSLLLTTHPAYQALNTIQTFAGDMDNNGSVIVADKMTLARSMLLTTHPAYQALTW